MLKKSVVKSSQFPINAPFGAHAFPLGKHGFALGWQRTHVCVKDKLGIRKKACSPSAGSPRGQSACSDLSRGHLPRQECLLSGNCPRQPRLSPGSRAHKAMGRWEFLEAPGPTRSWQGRSASYPGASLGQTPGHYPRRPRTFSCQRSICSVP